MKYKLEELVTIKYGKNQKKVKDENGIYPILGTGGQMGWANDFLYDKPSVLIPRKGSISRVMYIDEPFWTVDTLFYTIVNEKLVIPKYLYYNLSLIDFIHYNEGTTIPSLRTETLNKIELDIQPLNVQKQIVKILDCMENKININKKINTTLEEIAQAIFKHWFIDFEFPNKNGEPYKSSGGKFIDSELGLIPEGWKICNISDLCDISTKSVKPKKHENTLFEHYSIPAYDDSKFPVFEFGKEIKSNKYVVSIDSILVSKLNPTTKRVWDPVCITEQSICSTEFINYRPKNSKISSYVYCILNSDGFSEHLIQHATGSTGSRQRVKPKDTLSFTSLLPDMNTLYRFEGIIKPIREQIKLNHVSNWKLRELRDTLLPKLMSGEIRVPEAEEVVESCLQKNN